MTKKMSPWLMYVHEYSKRTGKGVQESMRDCSGTWPRDRQTFTASIKGTGQQSDIDSALLESREDLNRILKTKGKKLVLFYAEWCSFCKQFMPIFQQLMANGMKNLFMIQSEHKDMRRDFNVVTFPTLVKFPGDGGEGTKFPDGMVRTCQSVTDWYNN